MIQPVGHSKDIFSSVFSPDSRNVLTASQDGTAKIWDAVSGKLLAEIKGDYGEINAAIYSNSGKVIITTHKGGACCIWDSKTLRLLKKLENKDVKFFRPLLNKDDTRLIVNGQLKNEAWFVQIWDIQNAKLVADITGKVDNIKGTFSGVTNYRWGIISPDNKTVIVPGTNGNSSIIWNLETGKKVSELSGHRYDVLFASYSPDSRKVLTGSRDSTAKIWDVKTGNLLATIKGEKYVYIKGFSFTGGAFNNTGDKIVAVNGGTIRMWDALNGNLIRTIDTIYGANIAFFDKSSTQIVAVGNSFINIWDAKSGSLLSKNSTNGNNYGSKLFAFNEDKSKLAIGKADYLQDSIVIWDFVIKKKIAVFSTRGTPDYISFSKNGKSIIARAIPNLAKIWDIHSGKLVIELKGNGPSAYWYKGLFNKDGQRIIARSENVIKVWDIKTGRILLNLQNGNKTFYEGDFSTDGTKIITWTGGYFEKNDPNLIIWDANTGNRLKALYAGKGAMFNPEGNLLFIYSDYDVQIMDFESGKVLDKVGAGMGWYLKPIFSSNGKKVLIIDGNNAKVWDIDKKAVTAVLEGHTSSIYSANFSPDGSKIITGSGWDDPDDDNFDPTAKVWDTESGKLLSSLPGHEETIRRVILSPDGNKAVTVCDDDTIRVWHVDSGKFLFALQGDNKEISNLKFSNDNKKIIYHTFYYYGGGYNDNTFEWDAENGKIIHQPGKNKTVETINDLSPDGKYMLTGSPDNSLQLRDAKTGKLLYSFLAVNSKEFLVSDVKGRYDGSEAARKLLYFTCGTEIIELDQIKDQLWVPNLAERIMNGDSINTKTLNELNICSLTPEIEKKQDGASYNFIITPRRGGLGETVLFVNGIEARRYKKEQLINNKGLFELKVKKEDISRYFISGKGNVVTLKAYTADNAISSRGIELNDTISSQSSSPPNLYAVMVGVSDYKGDELDLKYAAKDATDISNAVALSAKKLLNTDGKEHVFSYNLTTEKDRYQLPEKNSIKKVLEEIGKKATANDILLIFFAGHGVMAANTKETGVNKDQFYFLTADASKSSAADAVKDVGISTAELTEWMKPENIKAQKRILILDACNSGQAIKDFVKMGTGDQNYIAARNDDNAKQIKAIDKLNEKSGLFILSASASSQSAYELGRYSQGLLTYSLLKAIKEQSDILEDGKYLNVSRWFNAAEKTVTELAKESGARQQPQIVSNTNFNIGEVDDEVLAKIVLPQEKPLFAASNFQNNDEAADGDDLELSKIINLQLNEMATRSAESKIVYVMGTNSPDAYTLSGRYDIKGNEVIVRVSIRKGREVKHRFELNGQKDKLKELANQVLEKAVQELKP